jgi:hypothetical protein
VRFGCRSSCPLLEDELTKAQALLLSLPGQRYARVSAAQPSVEQLVRWLQARAAQIRDEALREGSWTVANRGFRLMTIKVVLGAYGAPVFSVRSSAPVQ